MALPDSLKKDAPLVIITGGRSDNALKVTVSRVGRTWVYVKEEGRSDEYGGQFDRVTGVAKVGPGYARALVTPEQYAEMKECEQLRADLWDAGVEVRLGHRNKVSLAQLRALLAVMQAEEPRLLSCGWCHEENGEEVHSHPECPIGAPEDACVADGVVHPEHDFPPPDQGNECSRCGAEADDDGPDGVYDGEIR